MTDQPPRKGARRMSDVDAALRHELNKGATETVTLTEWYTVDQLALLARALDEIDRGDALAPITARLSALKNRSSKATTEAIGAGLLDAGITPDQRAALMAYPADSVRCWVASVIGQDTALPLADKLSAIRPLAADRHWNVREFAWLAVRPSLGQTEGEIHHALALLTPWTTDPDPNIRRYASEITRPRGVWCRHIAYLRQEPRPALPLLEPLHSDPSRYVQDSVANWLNDASKDHPDWVRAVCEGWSARSDSASTAYIVRRALRTLNKKG